MPTLLDIYQQIAKYDSNIWCEEILKDVNVTESRTLYTDYQSIFTETEWKKICIFEHHFAKDAVTYLSYEEKIRQKQSYLKHLIQIKSIAKTTVIKCEKTIQSNLDRKRAANEVNGVNLIDGEITHSYQRIDDTLNKCIEHYTSEKVKCRRKKLSPGKYCGPQKQMHRENRHEFKKCRI